MIRAGSRLFRNAIFIPGWNHGWDNIIKDVVRRWSWWPSFIAGLKACTRFFRVAAYRIAIAVHLRGELSAATLAGSDYEAGGADMYDNLGFEGFNVEEDV